MPQGYNNSAVRHGQVSLKITENGSFNVYSTSQEYKFTSDGLVRKAGKAASADAQTDPLSYKVAQHC